ncbi:MULTISPECIES: hypothetical protein [unclassified Pseudomonas]|uniref:hypothetical protein n=1 Tax=unclassified Pseudomonas TaxID=196821 RepID=UPI0024477332|nr:MULTISPECIES: hypothetical protein [unclassified Pseudomonas]MDG9928295.1 hypothetical protein [Pseudomonas sp. GD04042]MDH0481141.1 hypothetical protein [Pseudomonas sp. GD04015]MDH0604477.1 hypothetical protein [Pseudomonas sp. GD03869]
MGLPVKSCTDEELEDYAPIHPEAAQELAERFARGKSARLDREAALEEEARDAERAAERAEDDLNILKDECEACISRIREALELQDLQERYDQVKLALTKLENAL